MRRTLLTTCWGVGLYLALRAMGASAEEVRDFRVDYGTPAPTRTESTPAESQPGAGYGYPYAYGGYPYYGGYPSFANPMLSYSMLGFPGYGYAPTGYYSFGGLGGYSSLNYYNFGGLGSYPWAGYPNYGPYFSYLPLSQGPWGYSAWGAPFMNPGLIDSPPAAATPSPKGAENSGAAVVDFPREAGGSATTRSGHSVDFPKASDPPRPGADVP